MINHTVSVLGVAALLLLSKPDFSLALEPHPCLQETSPKTAPGISSHITPFSLHVPNGPSFILAGLILKTAKSEDLVAATTKAVARFLAAKELQVHIGKRAKADRYGRLPAFLSAQPHLSAQQSDSKENRKSDILQELLIERGLARVDVRHLSVACARQLLSVEKSARLEKIGVWNEPTTQPRNAKDLDLDATVSTFQIIQGKALSVSRNLDRTSYLNFGRNWASDFTVSISKGNLVTWETQNNKSLDDLANVPIYVRGWIEDRGGPLIRVTHPLQLEVGKKPE